MEKYRLVEEKIIGAHDFIDHSERNTRSSQEYSLNKAEQCTVKVTQQAKPRNCITTAMNILVRSAKVAFPLRVTNSDFLIIASHTPSTSTTLLHRQVEINM